MSGSFPSVHLRYVGLQVDQPAGVLATRQATPTTKGTPKKTPAKLAKTTNISGKKDKKTTFTDKIVNKCMVCGIIYNYL